MAGIVDSANLASYYTNKKYLSAEEMANLNSIVHKNTFAGGNSRWLW